MHFKSGYYFTVTMAEGISMGTSYCPRRYEIHFYSFSNLIIFYISFKLIFKFIIKIFI